jgi:phosphoglycolate phosphatase
VYRYIVFDLDGTLIDSLPEIAASVNHALKTCGFSEIPNERDLSWFVGPPLREGFKKLVNTSDDSLIEKLIVAYREIYEDICLEAKLYSGIQNLLIDLSKTKMLALATSKPTVFASRILERLELNHLFSTIAGSELDETHSTKEELIKHVIETCDAPCSDFVHIGDRRVDIISAKRNKIDSVGVLYGYGTAIEIEESNPTFIARDVNEVGSILASSV